MSNPPIERDQALLDALAQQANRVPAPMLFAAFFLGALAYEKIPAIILVIWVVMVFGIQTTRFVIVRKLASDKSKTTSRRLLIASFLSLANGLILGSSATFFIYLDEGSRAIYSMVMVGIMAGTIATSHGYRPVFIGLVIPLLCAVATVWLFPESSTLSTLQTYSLFILIVCLGLLLYASSRDVYKAFGESYETRQKLETALESERNANAAKTRFLAAASHDLRQPLHTMSMLSAALTLQDLNTKSRNIAENMNTAMADLSGELDSLLDISKLDAGIMRVRPTTFLLTKTLDRITSNYRELAERKQLSLNVNTVDNIHLNIDKSLFERVIRNLLDNAIKYTNEGSVSISSERHGDGCTIIVSDTGIGIPKEEQGRVKEEFYQLNNPERDRQKGLGLGLSIVWRLLPLIDAQLTMKSELNVGTQYELTIPCVSPKNNPVSLIEKPVFQQTEKLLKRHTGTRVLIVEDDKDVRQGTKTLLESSGFKVLEAVSSSSAIVVAQSYKIDIALVDLRLPNGDSGFTTIKSLKKIEPQLPIIIVSGESSPDVLQQAVSAECEFLVKPVDIHELIYEIDRSLTRSTVSI